MKRLLAFFVVVLGLTAIHPSQTGIFDCQQLSQACIIAQQQVDGAERVVKNGNQYFYYVSSNFAAFAQRFSQIDGIVLYFDSLSLEQFFEAYGVHNRFEGHSIDGCPVYYGYTAAYPDSVSVQAKRVNVQIIQKPDCLIAGFPVVLTGF